MGVIVKKYVEEDVMLGIWDITESLDELIEKAELDNADYTRLKSFGNDRRKSEWLSVRCLARDLTNKPNKIVYNENRKPFLSCNTFQISISHSRNLSSILLSKTKKVGIDLEYMSHNIHKIRHKFINDKEVISGGDKDQERLHLYIHWCAKEALYKICDKQDINFKQNLIIQPFQTAGEGRINGTVDNIHGIEDFDLHYFLIDNYTIVWCSK